MNPTAVTTTTPSAERLRGVCGDRLFLPGDPGYDAARTPWNVAVDQRPVAVAVPESVDEVRAVVRAAREAGLKVAAQSTGHNAGPLAGRLADAVLVRLSDLTGVTIDPERRIARVVGGTLWRDVIAAAAPHGLTALHGSSPDVAVAGYTLGGGLSWYARKHGLACNTLIAAEVVLADGSLTRVDPTNHPDLFWALRGGGGNFGIVTALELRLLPIADVFGGMLLWDGSHTAEVAHLWAEWTRTVPEEVTTALRLLSFPPLPDLPDFLRGRQLVAIDGALLTDDETATGLLAPLRALQPELDTFARIPAQVLTQIHMDPEQPTPGTSDHALLAELPHAAIDALVAACGPDSGSTLLSAELRHLGGALARSEADSGALARVSSGYSAFFVAIAATPELADQGRRDAAAAVAALTPWRSDERLANFTEESVPASAFEEPVRLVLGRIRDAFDPDRVFVANHPI